jgi:hypothetical protein
VAEIARDIHGTQIHPVRGLLSEGVNADFQDLFSEYRTGKIVFGIEGANVLWVYLLIPELWREPFFFCVDLRKSVSN